MLFNTNNCGIITSHLYSCIATMLRIFVLSCACNRLFYPISKISFKIRIIIRIKTNTIFGKFYFRFFRRIKYINPTIINTTYLYITTSCFNFKSIFIIRLFIYIKYGIASYCAYITIITSTKIGTYIVVFQFVITIFFNNPNINKIHIFWNFANYLILTNFVFYWHKHNFFI